MQEFIKNQIDVYKRQDVQWDNETRTVISYDSVSDVSITMQIDSDVMYVNGDAVTLETPAKIVGSSTVVPVRAIAEGMHSVVGWDEATKTVKMCIRDRHLQEYLLAF